MTIGCVVSEIVYYEKIPFHIYTNRLICYTIVIIKMCNVLIPLVLSCILYSTNRTYLNRFDKIDIFEYGLLNTDI